MARYFSNYKSHVTDQFDLQSVAESHFSPITDFLPVCRRFVQSSEWHNFNRLVSGSTTLSVVRAPASTRRDYSRTAVYTENAQSIIISSSSICINIFGELIIRVTLSE